MTPPYIGCVVNRTQNYNSNLPATKKWHRRGGAICYEIYALTVSTNFSNVARPSGVFL